MPANIKRATATGDITTAGAVLRAVTLTPAAAASSVTVRAGGSGGTVVLALNAPASGASVVLGGLCVWMSGGIHVTLSGASAECSVVYE